MTGKVNLKINQGETFRHSFKWLQPDGLTPVDMTGFAARLHIREKLEAATVLIELTTDNGGIEIDVETGTISLHISAANTTLITWLSGVYDLEVVNGPEVTRLVEGKVSVSKEVTR